MLDNYLRLGVTLSWLVIALLALGHALTLNTDRQRRRRPHGLEYNQRFAVMSALVLVGVALGAVVLAVGLMV